MKHIKKSMFISTVLMVVMLIAALSTATFAWYTSNNTVASSATNVGAAQSTSANIGIGFSSTATSTQIEFDALVAPNGDNAGKGNLYPVAPVTFYDFEGRTSYDGYNTPADAYVSSPYSNLTTAKGIIDTTPDNTTDATYIRRIINISNASDIKAATTFIHNKDATPNPIVTNLASSDFDNNYKKVYTTVEYAYNNGTGIATPVKDKYVSVSDYVYTALNTAVETQCYKVLNVYVVDQSSGVADVAQATSANDYKISQLCAYELLGSNLSRRPADGSYVVAYEVWHVDSFIYNLKNNETFQGYAATADSVVNSGDILGGDILASAINSNPYYLASTPVYDEATGFAYIYKIYDSANPGTIAPISASNFAGFVFNKAAIDATKSFKEDSKSANIGAVWSGYDNPPSGQNEKTYNASGKDLVLVTGRQDTTAAGTADKFYIYNRSTTTDISNITCTLNVSGDIPEFLRVAIFVGGKYYGTLANTNLKATTFGRILKNSKSTDMPTYAALKSVNLGQLQKESSLEIQLVVWFDGEDLNDNAAGKNCSFTLSFEAFTE